MSEPAPLFHTIRIPFGLFDPSASAASSAPMPPKQYRLPHWKSTDRQSHIQELLDSDDELPDLEAPASMSEPNQVVTVISNSNETINEGELVFASNPNVTMSGMPRPHIDIVNNSGQDIQPGYPIIASEYPILPSPAKAPSRDLDEFFKQELETWGRLQKAEDGFVNMVAQMKDEITRLSSRTAPPPPPNAASAAPVQNRFHQLNQSITEDLKETIAYGALNTVDSKRQRKRDKKRRYKANLKARKQQATSMDVDKNYYTMLLNMKGEDGKPLFKPCKFDTALFVVEQDKYLSIEEIKRSIDPVEMKKMKDALQTEPFTFQQHKGQYATEEKGHWSSQIYPGSGKMRRAQDKTAPPPASAPLNNTVFNITNERLWNGIPRKKITRKQYESMSKETMYAASAVATEALKRGESVERIHQLLDEELAKAAAEKTE